MRDFQTQANRRPSPKGARVAKTAQHKTAQHSLAGLLGFLLLTFFATALVAQESLTLSEAIRIAKENNPNFLQQANNQGAADWGVRQAYGSLLPRVTASAGASFREAGVERVGTQSFSAGSTDYYQSFYNLGFNWQLNGNTIYGMSTARANSAATHAGIEAAEFNLQQLVTLQYMTLLRARDAEEVARESWERSIQNHEIVTTRVSSGFAAGSDGQQAEVDMGRAEVALLRAEQLHRAEKARLMEQMGVMVEGGFEAVDEFEVFQPEWQLDELISDAMALHPSLRSMQASERAAGATVRQAQSAYLPTLTFSTNLNGFAQKALNNEFVLQQVQSGAASQMASCQRNNALSAIDSQLWSPSDCSRFAYTDDLGQQALALNTLSFDKNPIQLNLGISIPVFSGFSRQVQVEQAQAAEKDAQLSRRAEELRLRTAITQALDAVQSAYRSHDIEQRNLSLAQANLNTARQRYEVGNTSILELMDAETSLQTAQRDYLNSAYTFHQSLVVLEAATGRTLRPGTGMDDEDGEGAEG